LTRSAGFSAEIGGGQLLQNPHVAAQIQPTAMRIARPADLNFVAALQKKFAAALGFLPLQALAAYIDIGRVTLAQENGDAAGYLLGRTHLKCQPHVMPLVQTAICMDAQRREHGRSLVEAAAAEATLHGRSILQAWCRVDLEANEFWRCCGFEPIAIRRPETARGLPLILWRRPLDEHGRSTILHIPKFAGWRSRCDDPRRLITPADAAAYLRPKAA
jgi:N-acetylglutamate synthase-like GNAT family acetyltransferase